MELERLDATERLYKELYRKLPEIWRTPVRDWKELVRRYRKAGITGMPEEAPSVMGTVLKEEDFFEGKAREAVCFNNLRYCPPFLHQLEFIKIIYCMRGRVTVYLDEEEYRMEAGNLCMITPGVRHTVFSCGDEDIVINVLIRASSFSDAFSGILMEQNILSDFFWKILYTRHSKRVLLFRSGQDGKLDRWVERMYDESARGGESSNLLMKSYVMIFLGLVMREHLQELQTVEGLTQEVYALPAMIQAIRSDLKSVTLEELCRRFGMKEEELKRYIVQESGYTYSYLLRDLRMRRASWLLQNTFWSTERIMEEVGYSNTTNFYRAFKEYFGKTPSEYRRTGKEVLI